VSAAREVIAARGQDLAVRRDVVAVSVGRKIVAGEDTGAECVTVWVRHKLPDRELAPAERVPPSLRVDTGTEVVTDVVETARITGPPPLDVPGVAPVTPLPGLSVAQLRSYTRPVIGGLSAANWRFGFGTVATTATDTTYLGVTFALSCNHVLAGLNRFPLGDPVLQPAPADGGRWPAAVAGQLARYVPMRLDGAPNAVDAAVAYLPDATGVPGVTWLGPVTAVREEAGLTLGEAVQKVGRSTGLTEARIVGVDALVWVDYSETQLGGRALLAHQILTTPCAAYGDSGSLLLDEERRGVGMLCAGSTESTVFSSLELIQSELDIVVSTRLE
jgi:hypothetical protein